MGQELRLNADRLPVTHPDFGRRNSDANKLSLSDRSFHDWYRFVLSFPPHLVRHYLERFGIGPGKCVLDPFCGTGTTLVECRKLGIRSVGVEANPMAAYASQVKTDWSGLGQCLASHAQQIARSALDKLDRQGIDDCAIFPELTCPQNLRTVSAEQSKLLLAGSISPLPLHKALVLRDEIDMDCDSRYHHYEQLALAKALVNRISNLRFGPEVGVGRPKPDAIVIGAWLAEVEAMGNDLDAVCAPCGESMAQVHCADARDLLQVLPPHSVDAVITSPPYPNEKDYTRTTRLESVILGFIRSKADLQLLKRNMIRSNTRTIYKGDKDDAWITNHPEIHRLAEEIEARRVELGKTSGFERLYPRVTKLYFGGMARHLADLRCILRPGAQLAYVVGDQASYLRVLIRTGEILANIATDLGYEVLGLDLFRTRMSTATRAQLREEVVVLRWGGV